MENVWYYASGNKPVGPISLTDLKAVLSRSSDPANVLVWRRGDNKWVRANDVLELEPYLFEPPPLPNVQQTTSPAIRVSSGDRITPRVPATSSTSSSLHPWRRYFARIFDLYIFSLVFFFFLGLMFPEFFRSPQTQGTGDENFYWWSMLSTATYVIFETICLNTFGATFGKFLYGINIKLRGNCQIPFSIALKRALVVWVRGLGLGIPIVSLITLSVAYRNLLKEGETSWDRDFKFTIVHRPLSRFRWLGITVVWLLLLAIMAFLIENGR